MTPESKMKSNTERLGWVSFDDEPVATSKVQKPDGSHSLPQSASGLPVQQNVELSTASSSVSTKKDMPSTWIQFDDSPWTSSHPIEPPCPKDSLATNQNQSINFWSPVPPSERSWSAHSEDPSCTDMQSVNTDDHQSSGLSRTDSPNSSVFQEDEDVSMEAGSSAQSSKSVNGQMARNTARFASWVTFDDDDDDLSLHSSPKPSVIKLDNVCLTTVQDANSNLIVSDGSSTKKEVSINLLDWTPEKNESPSFLDSPFSEAKTPSKKKNPFLDEELSHVQPSPINPFSAYFDQPGPPLVDISQSNGTNSENTQVFAFSSPFLIEEADGKTNSLIQFSPTFDMNNEGMFKYPPRNETLEHLKQLQISVLDEQDLPLPDDSVITDELDEVPFEISYTQPKDGWPMMLRIPERKNIMSSRHWGPIFVKLTDSACLQLYYEKGMEKPFKELQLEASHELSEPKLQNYDENGRIHTVRIDHVTYKEKKKYHPKPAVIHAPVKEQLIKLGTLNYEDFQSFRIAVHKTLMHLPRDVDFLTTYSEEEISVEVRDEFCGMVSKNDSRILRHSVLTHISALAFISGTPLCKIGFNDIQVKGNEVVSRHDIIPNSTTRWIKLRDCHFHQCVEEQEFHNTRTIAFNPPRAQWFELMHFRTAFAEKSLPFSLRTVATINGAEVELQSWLVMSTGFSSNRDPLTLIPCENVMIRYPVPASWVKNFRRESVMGEKSLKAKMNKGASFGSSSVSGSEPVMRVTLGTAKYEQAFKAVVWRMNRLPDKNSASGHPHSFFCHLELGSDREVPATFTQYLDVEFDMPACSASRATVRSLSVGEKPEVKKWVSYKAHYTCQIEMDYKSVHVQDKEDGLQPERLAGCSQQ
ncbi:stonin-2 isoform X1 [Erpetoichthys calabaricus]|uniref:Stonin-2 n=2 Tax=Erpetoichthys calabaricus TaxID=27687 RepID=A0A8C4TDG5_ERPCA|nr:stonin-2 isoform X1 [Erpetoichthys calabaricus]XP_028677592.1 stonin-2 isoform X1 [Erpetoichthys calabaricus]